jgi:hypothetical protein
MSNAASCSGTYDGYVDGVVDLDQVGRSSRLRHFVNNDSGGNALQQTSMSRGMFIIHYVLGKHRAEVLLQAGSDELPDSIPSVREKNCFDPVGINRNIDVSHLDLTSTSC